MPNVLKNQLYETLIGLKSTISTALSSGRNCHFNVGKSLKVVRDSYLESLNEPKRGYVATVIAPIEFSIPAPSSRGIWTVDSSEAWRLYCQLAPLLAPGPLEGGATDVNKGSRNLNSKKVFIVHGHDEAEKLAAARFIEKLGFDPIVLHEQASEGKTVIEKFEKYSDVSFALILLTPDDEGRKLGAPALSPRARQNVVLELGYFIGKLGRDRVCALHKGNVEIPSDYLGVLFVALDAAGAWKLGVAKEMKAAGLTVDINAVL